MTHSDESGRVATPPEKGRHGFTVLSNAGSDRNLVAWEEPRDNGDYATVIAWVGAAELLYPIRSAVRLSSTARTMVADYLAERGA